MNIIDRKFEIFRMAAQLNHFTAAAAALGMTQPNVTRQIARLEEELGVELFERTTGRLALTSAGRALLRESDRLFAEEAELRRRVLNAAGAEKHFRLGGTMTAGAFLLPDLTVKYMKRHPEYRLDLHIANTDGVSEELKLRRLELALVEGPFDHNFFMSRKFREDELVPVSAPGAVAELFSLRDYLAGGGRLILRESGSGTRYYFELFLREQNIPLPPADRIMEIDNFDAIRQLVREGAGITVISRLAVETELRFGVLAASRFAEGEIRRDLNFIYLPGENLRFVEDFIAFSCRSAVHRNASDGVLP